MPCSIGTLLGDQSLTPVEENKMENLIGNQKVD